MPRTRRCRAVALLAGLAGCWSGGIDESATLVTDIQMSQVNCARNAGNELRCWGSVPPELGGQEYPPLSSPVRVPRGRTPQLTLVRSSFSHGCGLEANGTAWCWGNNDVGQVGDGTRNQSGRRALTQVAQAEPFTDVGVGGSVSCGLGRSGTVYCWGFAEYAAIPPSAQREQCIVGSGLFQDTLPCVTRPTAIAIAEPSQFLSVAADHGCVVNRAGALSCWGANFNGELGVGDSVNFAQAPRPVPGLASAVRDLSTGGSGTCASLADGSVWCWGSNQSGQGGTASTGTEFLPVRVPAPDGVSLRGVARADSHSCALSQDNAAWCWGSSLAAGNASGARQAPSPVLGNLRFTRVAVNDGYDASFSARGTTCGVGDDGAWCWGAQPGDGSGQVAVLPVRLQGQGAAD